MDRPTLRLTSVTIGTDEPGRLAAFAGHSMTIFEFTRSAA